MGHATKTRNRCGSKETTSSTQGLAGAMFWELSNDDGHAAGCAADRVGGVALKEAEYLLSLLTLW